MGNDWTIFNPDQRKAAEVINYLKENADIFTEYESGRPILALSTCYGDTMSSRLIVFGYLIER